MSRGKQQFGLSWNDWVWLCGLADNSQSFRFGLATPLAGLCEPAARQSCLSVAADPVLITLACIAMHSLRRQLFQLFTPPPLLFPTHTYIHIPMNTHTQAYNHQHQLAGLLFICLAVGGQKSRTWLDGRQQTCQHWGGGSTTLPCSSYSS